MRPASSFGTGSAPNGYGASPHQRHRLAKYVDNKSETDDDRPSDANFSCRPRRDLPPPPWPAIRASRATTAPRGCSRLLHEAGRRQASTRSRNSRVPGATRGHGPRRRARLATAGGAGGQSRHYETGTAQKCYHNPLLTETAPSGRRENSDIVHGCKTRRPAFSTQNEEQQDCEQGPDQDAA